MATYAIGDLQGCYLSLQALLKKIHFNPTYDKLWFVGDLVNRGPDSLSCLRFIKNLGDKAITVLGNHDLHLLAVFHKATKILSSDSFQDILTAPDCKELCHWLQQLPLLHYDKTLNFTLVHAGIYPQWSLTQAIELAEEVHQNLKMSNEFFRHMYNRNAECWDEHYTDWKRLRFITNAFTRMRFVNEHQCLNLNYKGTLADAPANLIPWFKVSPRAANKDNIVFGHWAALEGERLNEPHIYPIDNGCVWGRMLTALCLETLTLFSVPAQE